jgi:hypothetical protein
VTGVWLIDPLTLANEHQRFFRVRSSLGKSQSLLILCKCGVPIVASTLRIEPHAVFEDIIIEISGARFCLTWVLANTIEFNC